MSTTKRFGARYGRKPKTKFAQIEALHQGRHKCPYCSKVGVRRVAAGIWNCIKCDTKFAGRAYEFKGKILGE